MQITISKKIIIVFIGILCATTAIFGMYYTLHKRDEKKTTIVLSAQNISVPVYFPSNLPVGYSIDKNTINKTKSVASYTISTPSSEDIFVSIQDKPEEDILNKFHTEQLGLPETIVTPNGEVVIGQVRGRYTASVAIDKHWIIATAPLSIEYSQFQELAASFEQE